jgi:hypothetical protein
VKLGKVASCKKKSVLLKQQGTCLLKHKADKAKGTYELREAVRRHKVVPSGRGGGALAVLQVDDLIEGDAGSLDARFPSVLAPQLRSVHHRQTTPIRIIRISCDRSIAGDKYHQR